MPNSETQDTNLGEGKSLAASNVVSDDVMKRDAASESWMLLSTLPRSLMEGTRGMRAAGTLFLPKHQLETKEGYEARLIRSTLLNAYRKTASYLGGQVFQTDIVFSEEVDERSISWSESIDTKRNALDVFAKRVFINGIAKGAAHILVDLPKIDPTTVVTQQDEEDAGVRPYFKEIRAEDVLGALVDENGFLKQVRIAETTTRQTSEFAVEIVYRVRVLDPGMWRVYELNADKSISLVESGTFSITAIPFVTFIPGEEWSIITGETPLMDLAELNAKHWRSSSDQDNILHVARVPILFGRHIDLAAVPVGTSSMITSSDDNSDMKFVEIQGGAISAGREDLKETEAQMALYGLQQLVPRTGNMTATEKALNSAESSSSLGTWAIEYESCLQLAFEIANLFMKSTFPPEGLKLNKEFLYGIADPQELAQLLKANEQGILSAQATFSEFRRRGVFDEHLTWEDMEADLEQEKRDALEAAQLAGSAFGKQPTGDSKADDNNQQKEGDDV